MNKRLDDTDKEWISALADGQLRDAALSQALDALVRDPDACQTWHAYHLIGDILRAPDLAGGTPPGTFLADLSQRLAGEPPPAAHPAGEFPPGGPTGI
jgi:sigma-E factor negative regulatory protein RseA